MTRSQPLAAAAALLGLAMVCRGIQVHEDGSRAPSEPRPFEPAQDAIMVYSRGKTGTTSLQNAAGNMMEPPCKVNGKSVRNRAVKCHFASCALPFVKSRPEGSRTWVITSNRNPFARYPSGFFQGISHWPREKIQHTSMHELLSLFHSGEGSAGGEIVHGIPHQQLDWYKQNFYDPFGVNITSHKFDFDKKLLRVRYEFDRRTLEILVVRLEDSDQWEAILAPFFPNLNLTTISNSADAKDDVLKTKYKEFVGAMEYTDDEVELISQSDELAAFYTRKEKDQFVQSARRASSRMSATHAEDFLFDDPVDRLPPC